MGGLKGGGLEGRLSNEGLPSHFSKVPKVLTHQ